MQSCKQDEATVGYTIYIDNTATAYWRECESSALWQLIDVWTSGVFSVKRKPEDIIQRVEMDSVTEYLHQKLQDKRRNVQVNCSFSALSYYKGT